MYRKYPVIIVQHSKFVIFPSDSISRNKIKTINTITKSSISIFGWSIMYPRFKILIDPIMTVNIISRDPISWPMTKSVEPESNAI